MCLTSILESRCLHDKFCKFSNQKEAHDWSILFWRGGIELGFEQTNDMPMSLISMLE